VVANLAATGPWKGTATELLGAIHRLPVEEQVSVPGSASVLSATLRWRAQRNVLKARVEFLGRVGHRGTRLISISAK
jgi:hypothetical protein